MSVTANKSASKTSSQTSLLAAEYARRRRQKRSMAGKRADGRVQKAVSRDQLRLVVAEKVQSRGRVLTRGILYTLAALFIHGSLVAGVFLIREEPSAPASRSLFAPEKVTVKITPRSIDRKPVELPPADAVEDKPQVAVEEPVVAPPEKVVKKKLFAKAGKKRTVLPPNAGLAADPVDLAPAPPSEQKSPPRRRVVGLSFESTVKGGGGATFAVGNTRMGETSDRAADPSRVEKLRGEAIRVGAPEQVGPNRAATVIPTAKKEFKKPKRITKTTLPYPRTLKEQGIEGNVVVLIRISADGSVERVKVLKSSGYPEFDDAAARAAARERFTPATKDGEPIDYNLKYTYRFRIRQA